MIFSRSKTALREIPSGRWRGAKERPLTENDIEDTSEIGGLEGLIKTNPYRRNFQSPRRSGSYLVRPIIVTLERFISG